MLFDQQFAEKAELFPPTEPGGLVPMKDEGGETPYRFTPFEEKTVYPPPPMQPPVGYGKQTGKRKIKHATQVDMDDLLEEGEKKSKELDAGGSATGVKGLPPPPKGGPPRRGTPGGVAGNSGGEAGADEGGGEVQESGEKTPTQEEHGQSPEN